MDYEKKYNEALERAQKATRAGGDVAMVIVQNIFPELRESEDERIRKEICNFLIDMECKKEWIIYLEKQKELDRIVPEREATDFEIEVHEIIAQARSDKRLADKDVLEQFEQEAACSLMWKAEKQLRNSEKQKEQKRPTLDDPFLYGDWDKELLNEIHSWLGHLDGKYTPYSIDDIKHTARHFVEWQKEQMLKDAVEGYVNYYEDSGGILMAEAQVGCPYHNGDKVRIVVLKEEEE